MAYFEVNKKPPLSFPTLTGSIVTFNSQYVGLPLKSHKIALTATQSGSGTPSPDNVRPISGWSAINIGNSNSLSDIPHYDGIVNGTFDYVEMSSLNWTLNSRNSANTATIFYTQDLTNIKANGIVSFSLNLTKSTSATWSGMGANEYLNTGNGYFVIALDYNNVTALKTALEGEYLIYEVISAVTPDISGADIDGLFTAFNISGQHFTIQIGSTVYGGEYDARTGVLMAMPTAPTLDKNSYWVRNASGIFYISTPTGMTDLTMCNMFEVINKGSASGLANYQCRMSANGQFINFRVNSCDTLEDFKTWLGDNVITIWGTFNNPTTIQLPPCPIDTLEGVNNIWADTGDTTLQYPKFG